MWSWTAGLLLLAWIVTQACMLVWIWRRAREDNAESNAAEERFRSICNSVGVGVFELDSRGCCFYANPAALAIFDRSFPGVAGEGWLGTIQPEDRGRLEHAGRESFNGQLKLVRSGGEEREIWIRTYPIPDAHMMVGTIADVTERRRSEQESMRARDAAVAANQARGEFLANVSHEIRTPMHGIIGMTDLVLASQLTSDQRDYMESVKGSAEDLVRIIDDLLDFSRMEAGQLVIQNAPFDLERTIQTTIQTLSVKLQEKDLELSSMIAEDTPLRINGDAARLRQLLVNLVSNAIQFTEAGEISLRVEAENVDDRQVMLHFTVRDTGTGIAAHRLEKIFQPAGHERHASGSLGLGLPICARIVEAMGGRIWAVSETGRGSEFHFTAGFGLVELENRARVLLVVNQPLERRILANALSAVSLDVVSVGTPEGALDRAAPAKLPFDVLVVDRPADSLRALGLPAIVAGEQPDASEVVEAVESLLVRPAARRRAATKSARILVAEDNAVSQKIAQRLLEKAGHEVTLAGDGETAVRLAGEQAFDLCFMDMHMPVVDGLEATLQIRRLEDALHAHHMPIVAMTANAMSAHRETCLAAGMDDYIAKPVSREDLARVLDHWLAERR